MLHFNNYCLWKWEYVVILHETHMPVYIIIAFSTGWPTDTSSRERIEAPFHHTFKKRGQHFLEELFHQSQLLVDRGKKVVNTILQYQLLLSRLFWSLNNYMFFSFFPIFHINNIVFSFMNSFIHLRGVFSIRTLYWKKTLDIIFIEKNFILYILNTTFLLQTTPSFFSCVMDPTPCPYC